MKHGYKEQRTIHAIIYHVFTVIFALVMLYPLIWMVLGSFKNSNEILRNAAQLFPNPFITTNYTTGWKGFAGYSFGIFFKNSFIIAGISTIGAVISSAIVGYGFARCKFRLRGFWFACMLLAMMLLLLSAAIQSDFLRKIACFGFLIVFLRIFLWDVANFSPSAESFRESFLSGGVFTLSLIVSWIALVLQAKRRQEEREKLQLQRTLFGLAGGIAFFLYTSLELYKLLRLILPDFTRGGVSLWWGVLAVGFLFAGILGRWKSCRVFGLVVFGLCSLKVFFYDLAGYHLLAKSIGLLVLSVVMIAGALLYIRFRDRFDRKDGET